MQPATSPLIEVFPYPTIETRQPRMWEDLPDIGATANSLKQKITPASPTAPVTSTPAPGRAKEDTGQEIALSFEAGRKQGILEERQAIEEEQYAAMHAIEKHRIEQAAQLVEQFSSERDHFLQSAEIEVARLALAIAARILRREAQMDPLFLTGAVRVALGQLAQTTKVRLRVPAGEAELWSETLEHIRTLKLKPTVIADENLHAGDCLLESELGSADLSVNAQLGEIERALLEEAAPDVRILRTEFVGVSS